MPAALSAWPLASSLTSASTSCPAFLRASATVEPMYPLPPVKKTFMNPPRWRALCVRRVADVAKSKHVGAVHSPAGARAAYCPPPPRPPPPPPPPYVQQPPPQNTNYHII